MQNPTAHSGPFVSVFDRVFDAVVVGAGFAGYAAARSLAARGLSALIVESSGDLLWEATRALENTATSPSAPCPAWDAWLGDLRERQAANENFFEPALAEILAARELSAKPATTATPPPSIVLYAAPVALEHEEQRVCAVIVATKDGPRRIRANRWLDTTERGDVARLAAPALTLRAPLRLERSLLLHTREPGVLDAALAQLINRHPDLASLPSVRGEERRLRWTCAASASTDWHRRAPALVAELRELAGASLPFAASLCAMRDFPIYDRGATADISALPENLFTASPALVPDALATPGDRFALGTSAADACVALPAPSFSRANNVLPPATLPTPARDFTPADVLVAGVGTGGSHAAIAAARAGARVCAIDLTSWPGGVGTGAGICGYFHGAKGGLQSEIDEATRQLTELFTGAPALPHVWHHEAKKIALLNLFAAAGVGFLGEALLVGVERDGKGRGTAALVVVESELLRLPATSFIDATGDGDLAVFAGARFAEGRPGDARTLSYSQSIFSLAEKDGRPLVRSCNFDAGWVDPLDVEDLTRARLLGIAQHFSEGAWTKPDRAFAVAPWIGLRQSRHIETDFTVTMSDLVGSARFDDSVGVTETVADTHSVDFEFETDELAFYYWTCRGFRNALHCDLPYRMLLPRGLPNVWVACRAAGVAVDAAYGLRMQRDLQRLGEAAGLAAAQAAARGVASREVDLAALRSALTASGALSAAISAADNSAPDSAASDELLAALDRGLPGVHLWHLSRDHERHADAVRVRLASPSPRVSFYAAALLAMWNDPAGEARLLVALRDFEVGPTPEEKPVIGAFAQCIDLPFWLQAALLLRRVGTAASLPALRAAASAHDQPLNVRTILALTLERLASRLGATEDLLAALDALAASSVPDPVLPPSRSLWRTLHGEPQKKLGNDRGAPVAQDHTWQLHLILARTRRALGLSPAPEATVFAQDERAFVRHAFALAQGAA